MVTDFPVIRYAMNGSDNQFPSLSWIPHAFRNIVARFVEGGDWLREKIHQSRYAHIPVGNLE